MAQIPDVSAGFAGGVKFWLFLTIGLALLGYAAWLSIVLGAVGGLAWGLVVAWLNSQDDGVVVKASQPTDGEASASREVMVEKEETKPRFQEYGLTGLRPRRPNRAARRFGWMFRKNP